MARADVIETQTDETQTNGSESDEQVAKRQRVDLEALAAEKPNDKVVLSLQIPAGLKLAIRKRADESDESEAEFVRNMLAVQFEYTIPEEFNERRGRQSTKFAGMSEEEKKAAIAAENAKKREQVTSVLEAVQSNPEAAALLASMGIDITKLPKPRKAKAS